MECEEDELPRKEFMKEYNEEPDPRAPKKLNTRDCVFIIIKVKGEIQPFS